MKATNYRDVLDFHAKYGLMGVVNDPRQLTSEKLRERLEFMWEELHEFASASGFSFGESGSFEIKWFKMSDTKSIEDQADALVDLVYVAIGTAIMMGLPWQQIWDEVHKCNMQKVAGITKRGHAVDVTKPEGWTPPNHAKILDGYEYLYEEFDDSNHNEMPRLRHLPPISVNDSRDLHIQNPDGTTYVINNFECFPDENYLDVVNDESDFKLHAKVLTTQELKIELKRRGYEVAKERVSSNPHGEIGSRTEPVGTADTKALLQELERRGGHPGALAHAALLCIEKSEDYNHGKTTDPHKVDRSEYFPFGNVSYAQMLHTKALRFNSLVQKSLDGKDSNFEGLNDTALDIINYAGFFLSRKAKI